MYAQVSLAVAWLSDIIKSLVTGGMELKLNRGIILLLCLLFITSLVSACGISDKQKGMYNDNGKIAQDGDSFSYVNRTGADDPNDKININYYGFYGTDTIWVIESKENGEVTFQYDSTVKSGDFKAVLISPKKEIEDILTGNEKGSKTIKLKDGKYLFKIVGRAAKGKIQISADKNESVTITKNNHK